MQNFSKINSNNDDENNENFRELLQTVVKYGTLNILEMVLQKLPEMRELVKNFNTSHDFAFFHDCFENSEFNSESEIIEKTKILRYLVQLNPSLLKEKDERSGRTLLLSENIHSKIQQEMIKLGADPFVQDQRNGNTFLHICNSKWSYCTAKPGVTPEDYEELVFGIPEDILKKLANLQNMAGENPLMSSLAMIDVTNATLEKFKEVGADFNLGNCSQLGYVFVSDCPTALIAIREGRSLSTLSKLFELGANVNWTAKNGKNWGLLHFAAYEGRTDVIEFLLDNYKFDVNGKDRDGQTPLNYVINSDFSSYKAGVVLKKRGGNYKEFNDSSELYDQAERFTPSSLKLLVKVGGIDPNIKDNEGNTLLHSQFNGYSSNFLKIKILVEDGQADPNLVNNEGKTAFEMGLEKEMLNFESFGFLKEMTKINWTESLATQALYHLATAGDVEVDSKLFKEIDQVGFNMSYERDGWSLLQIATESGSEAVINYLVEKGSDLNYTNRESRTVLHIASRAKSKDRFGLIKYFIENGVDVNKLDRNNHTFLDVYLRSGINKRDSDYESRLSEYYTLPSVEFHFLTEFLVERNLTGLFKFGDGRIPKKWIFFEPLECTLKLLQNNGVEV